MTQHISAFIFPCASRCCPESTRETAGTGLGLALVKKFTEAHSGSVEIINAKPDGTIIKVSLPRIRNEHPDSNRPPDST